MASASSKLNIATYFIMSSPPGEVDDVITDVIKLVDDASTVGEEAVTSILKDYNAEQLVWGPSLDEKTPVMVSAYGAVAADEYVDANTGRVLKFDHRRRKFTEDTDKKQALPGPVAAYRASVQKSVDVYLASSFKAGKAVATVYGADTGVLTVCLSAKNVNLSNFWTGGWRSVYTINVGKRGQSELKGNIKVQVHYFEDGNVQLHTNYDRTASVTVGSEEETGKEVSKALLKIESDFQSNLEEMYVNMHRTTFKSMRRFLPLNRQPMTWSLAAHSLAGEVTRAS
jgi:capping protein alpha